MLQPPMDSRRPVPRHKVDIQPVALLKSLSQSLHGMLVGTLKFLSPRHIDHIDL